MNQKTGDMLLRVVKERLSKNRASRRRTAAKLNIDWQDYKEIEEIVKSKLDEPKEEPENEVA